MNDSTQPSSNDLLAEAARFIEGFAASGESGFARQRKALDWMMRYRNFSMQPAPEPSADATDAARYRWLRGHIAPSALERITRTPKSLIADTRPEALDAEIDLRIGGKVGAGAGPTKSARRYACAGCGKDIEDCECSKLGENGG